MYHLLQNTFKTSWDIFKENRKNRKNVGVMFSKILEPWGKVTSEEEEEYLFSEIKR